MSVSLVLWTFALGLALYRAYKWSVYKPPGFPPGPPRIPLLGSFWAMMLVNRKELHKAIRTLSRWYKTDLLGLWLGGAPTIVAQSYELSREVFRRSEFDGKPDFFPARIREPNHNLLGIFFQEGEMWKSQRWFLLRYMRDFGFGRRHDAFEAEIHADIHSFVEMIREGPKFAHEKAVLKENGVALVPHVFTGHIVNAFFQVIIGEKLSREAMTEIYE